MQLGLDPEHKDDNGCSALHLLGHFKQDVEDELETFRVLTSSKHGIDTDTVTEIFQRPYHGSPQLADQLISACRPMNDYREVEHLVLRVALRKIGLFGAEWDTWIRRTLCSQPDIHMSL